MGKRRENEASENQGQDVWSVLETDGETSWADRGEIRTSV